MTPAGPRPTFAEILDWLDGHLAPDAAARMAERVATGDARTERTVAWIRAFLQRSKDAPVHSPPPLVRQRLRQAFDAHHGRPVEPVTLTAELTFDSRFQSELIGVRTHQLEGGDTHQLAFRAETIDVLLDVGPDTNRTFRLDGQVFQPAPTALVWEARAEHSGGHLRDVTGDELGCFSLRAVAPGPVQLTLTNGEHELKLSLDLGADAD